MQRNQRGRIITALFSLLLTTVVGLLRSAVNIPLPAIVRMYALPLWIIGLLLMALVTIMGTTQQEVIAPHPTRTRHRFDEPDYNAPTYIRRGWNWTSTIVSLIYLFALVLCVIITKSPDATTYEPLLITIGVFGLFALITFIPALIHRSVRGGKMGLLLVLIFIELGLCSFMGTRGTANMSMNEAGLFEWLIVIIGGGILYLSMARRR